MQGGGCSVSFLMSGMICTDLELKKVQFAGAANCVTISPSLIPLTSEKWAFKLGETQEKNVVDVSPYKQLCGSREKQRDSRGVAMASYMKALKLFASDLKSCLPFDMNILAVAIWGRKILDGAQDRILAHFQRACRWWKIPSQAIQVAIYSLKECTVH